MTLQLTPFDADVAELVAGIRRTLLEPPRRPELLLSFGRWAVVQRDSLAVRAASPLAVAMVALVAGFALGALSAALVVSSFAKARTSTTSGKAVTAPRPPTAGAATAKVSLISSSSSASASASLDKPSSGASLLDARLLREAVKSKDLAEAEAASAKREAAALHEEVAALEAKLAASQRTRRAVAAELAAAFGLPPTPTPASAPPRSGLGGGDSGGPSAASRFFASPAAAPGSEGRASRVAKALAAA